MSARSRTPGPISHYERVKVTSISTEDLPYELQSSDIIDILEDTGAIKALTRRQRPVARLLAQGYTRKEVAAKRGVCVQAVHQMVLVMRKRLRKHLEKQREL